MAFLGVDDELRRVLMEHYRKPRHRGCLKTPTHKARVLNRYCGDELALELEIEGEKIADAAFAGQVCSVTQTSASLMTDYIIGRSVQQSGDAIREFRRLMRSEERTMNLGDMEVLAGVARFPSRADCALLAWEALEQALRGKSSIDRTEGHLE